MIDYLDLIGVPFAYGGRGPDTYDCYGLLMELHRRQGLVIPNYQSSSNTSIASESMKASIEQKVWLELWKKTETRAAPETADLRTGRVLLLNIKGLPCHVGMVIGPDRFVHTWEGVGGVLTERITLWKQRILGIYTFNDC